MIQTKWTEKMGLKPNYEVISLEANQLNELVDMLLTEICGAKINFTIENLVEYDQNTVVVSIDFDSLTTQQKEMLATQGIVEISETHGEIENNQAIFEELFGLNFDSIQLDINTFSYLIFIYKGNSGLVVPTSYGDIEVEPIYDDAYPGVKIDFKGKHALGGGGLVAVIEVDEEIGEIQTCAYDNNYDEPTHVIQNKYFIMKNVKGEVIIEDLPYEINGNDRLVTVKTPCEQNKTSFFLNSYTGEDDDRDWGFFIEHNSQEIEEWLFGCGYKVIADFRADY